MAKRRGSQRRHTKAISKQQATQWRYIFLALATRRSQQHNVHSELLCQSLVAYLQCLQDFNRHVYRTRTIHLSQYTFNFNALTDADCVFYFRFAKKDIGNVATALAWPTAKSHTSRNRYSVSALLSTCVMLRRMAGPFRWRELELQFGKHASQLSEIFWEGVEAFLEARVFLLTSTLSSQYVQREADIFSSAVAQNLDCLGNYIGFYRWDSIEDC